jgi:hypothetical protein
VSGPSADDFAVEYAAAVLLRALLPQDTPDYVAAGQAAVRAAVAEHFGGLVGELDRTDDWPAGARAALDRAFSTCPDLRPGLLRLADASGLPLLDAIEEEVLVGLGLDGLRERPDFRRYSLWVADDAADFAARTGAADGQQAAAGQFAEFLVALREVLATRVMRAYLHLRAGHATQIVLLRMRGDWWARPVGGFWSTFVAETPRRVRVVPGEESELILGPDAGDADLARLAPLRYVPDFRRLEIASDRVTNVGLAHLAGLPIRELSVRARISDPGLGVLGRLPRLESLAIWGGAVSGSFLWQPA